MEEGNNGALELGARGGLNRGRSKRAPDDGLADVGGNEEGDTRAETVALLEHLVPNNDEETSTDKLGDEEETVGDTDGTVHARVDIDEALNDSDDNTNN